MRKIRTNAQGKGGEREQLGGGEGGKINDGGSMEEEGKGKQRQMEGR